MLYAPMPLCRIDFDGQIFRIAWCQHDLAQIYHLPTTCFGLFDKDQSPMARIAYKKTVLENDTLLDDSEISPSVGQDECWSEIAHTVLI